MRRMFKTVAIIVGAISILLGFIYIFDIGHIKTATGRFFSWLTGKKEKV